ncbi:hypothetical protein OIU85_002939 [Salix viminalis]|uniref:DUF4283 domain-containing protein n=1 Tax=Salix viminalis TaxID=40686 RepID=A0A9Q0VPU1_SALVM|nr:hypothetical protein OIU85_002939 [Salix viminalis]
MNPSTQLHPKRTPVPPKETHPLTGNSWAEKVRISDSSTRFKLDPIKRQTTGSQLCISEKMLLQNAGHWSRCMVGFIPGFKMSYNMANTLASRVWRSCGLEQVTSMANGFLLFRFSMEEQMQSVMEKGLWLFGGKAIILQQWHPAYRFDKNKITKLPVWVRLHGLPFPLWTQAGLSLAASMVGRPLSCDSLTYNCKRLEYARLCVEIDAGLPKVSNFEIVSPLSSEPITVEVEYEWMPPYCAKCKIYGHSCKKTTQAIPALTNEQPNTLAATTPVTLPTINTTQNPQPIVSNPSKTTKNNHHDHTIASTSTHTVTPQNPKSQSNTIPNPIPATAQAQNPPLGSHKPSHNQNFSSAQIAKGKHVAIVTFNHNVEHCLVNKMDSIGSQSSHTASADVTQEESTASGNCRRRL